MHGVIAEPERTADALLNVLSQGHKRTAASVIIDLETLNGTDKPARLLGGGELAGKNTGRQRPVHPPGQGQGSWPRREVTRPGRPTR
ncbi:MAG: hypothetical protein JWO67_7282 [Streptosporangiaceae bacterium]|jgi:hypothetical protein|nr:hypothetical protein [Streptosporangiaceae bacterium]